MRDGVRKKYELTENGRLGPSTGDDREVKILNRIARWTAKRIEYEADPRQAERLVSDLRLDDAKGLSHRVRYDESGRAPGGREAHRLESHRR